MSKEKARQLVNKVATEIRGVVSEHRNKNGQLLAFDVLVSGICKFRVETMNGKSFYIQYDSR